MHLHLESPGETLSAVVVGAVLATVGGFVATQFETIMRRREREHSAAMLFGEILAALETIAAIAVGSHTRGRPFGPVTMRLLRAAQRETQAYERNRALLYDLRDARIRIQIHVLMVRVTLAVEGVVEASDQIDAAEAALAAASGVEESSRMSERLALLTQDRETVFAYTIETVAEVKSLVTALQPLARVNFDELKQYSGNPYAD